MKDNWTRFKISDVFNLQMGKTPSRANNAYWNGETPWVSISDMSNVKYISDSKEKITNEAIIKTGIKEVPIHTVIMSFKLSVGKVAITAQNLYTNEAIMAFIPKDEFDLLPEFVYYSLMGHRWEGSNRAVMGVTLNKTTISRSDYSFPPFEEQKRIVEELELLSGIIEKQKQQLKELDILAQSIFYDMFGDPITNEKGWEVKNLREECKEIKYGTSKPANEQGKFKYLRMNNITYEGELDLTNLKRISLGNDEIEKYTVKYGDILFNRTNSLDLIGKTCMFNLLEPMVIAGYIIRIRLSEMLNPKFFAKMFNLPSIKSLLKKIAKGAVNQANINSKELASIKIILPPLPLQILFASKIEAIEKQKEDINKSIEETQKLFDYTMDKYFG